MKKQQKKLKNIKKNSFYLDYYRFNNKFEHLLLKSNLYCDLKYLFAYIHLNPVKIKVGEEDWEKKIIPDSVAARKFLEDYRFSSYHDYVGHPRIASKILNGIYNIT